jgi:hypothetical protein
MKKHRLNYPSCTNCIPDPNVMALHEQVLLKAPSVSRNAPRAIFLCSVAFSMLLTTLCSAVSVDLPIL